MSKKRKTRKEKIAASHRSTHIAQNPESSLYSISTFSVATSQEKTITHAEQIHSTTEYAYILTDTKHTLFITSILGAASLIFYYLIQSHIINLALFGY